MKIKTYLPVFQGFYNSIYQYNDDNELYNINQYRIENNLNEIDYENLNIDYENYEKDIAINLCKVIKNYLSEYVENIIFENIYYPKVYNFKNDSINCIIIPKIENIKKFIYDNKIDYIEYLKNHYTNYDGFISHYSNNFDKWIEYTDNFTNFNNNGHYLGSILQFICDLIIDDDISIYYDVIENIYQSEYIINYNECMNNPSCKLCNKIIDDKNILNDFEKYKNIMGKYTRNIYCTECIENILV
jgi:hypothetical protein